MWHWFCGLHLRVLADSPCTSFSAIKLHAFWPLLAQWWLPPTYLRLFSASFSLLLAYFWRTFGYFLGHVWLLSATFKGPICADDLLLATFNRPPVILGRFSGCTFARPQAPGALYKGTSVPSTWYQILGTYPSQTRWVAAVFDHPVVGYLLWRNVQQCWLLAALCSGNCFAYNTKLRQCLTDSSIAVCKYAARLM